MKLVGSVNRIVYKCLIISKVKALEGGKITLGIVLDIEEHFQHCFLH